MNSITSKGDPILDAAALCVQAPRALDALVADLVKLGWHEDVAERASRTAMNSLYIYQRADGICYPGPRAPR